MFRVICAQRFFAHCSIGALNVSATYPCIRSLRMTRWEERHSAIVPRMHTRNDVPEKAPHRRCKACFPFVPTRMPRDAQGLYFSANKFSFEEFPRQKKFCSLFPARKRSRMSAAPFVFLNYIRPYSLSIWMMCAFSASFASTIGRRNLPPGRPRRFTAVLTGIGLVMKKRPLLIG